MRVEFQGKLDILSITATEMLNSITSLTLRSLVPKIVERDLKKSLLIRESYYRFYHFVFFQFAHVFNEVTVNCIMTSSLI